ncbi:MAG: DUF3306 domain-containing protein, partial [Gammaproteobacteria bacterium]|nr:DUF3306 domain-containing protein [Gammaproteobacteria bacterium]
MAKTPPANTDVEERFLARWSRRKRDEQDPETRDPDAPAMPEPNQEVAPTTGEETSAPVKTDEDMPPIEAIDEATDMRDFFSPQVSEGLRRVALRKLFHLPKFNVVDRLDDYNDNFRNFAALGDIITADMRHQIERAKEQAQAILDEPAGDEPARDVVEEHDLKG